MPDSAKLITPACGPCLCLPISISGVQPDSSNLITPACGSCRYVHCTLCLQAPWLDEVPPTLKDLMGSIMAYATCASEQQGLTQLSHALDPDSLLAAGGHPGKH